MFIDLISIWAGLREPSNAMRYLTGILFGGAFSVYLYPAFVSLVFSDGRNHAAINSVIKYGIFIFASFTAFSERSRSYNDFYYSLRAFVYWFYLSSNYSGNRQYKGSKQVKQGMRDI